MRFMCEVVCAPLYSGACSVFRGVMRFLVLVALCVPVHVTTPLMPALHAGVSSNKLLRRP
jgi:hypothetical protein